MRTYLLIGTVCLGPLLSSCSTQHKPMSLPPPPYKVCSDDEDPKTHNCKKNSPTSTIGIRGFKD